MRFFLGSPRDEERTDGQSSSDDEEEAEGSKQEARTLKEVLQQFRHAKKTRKRKKHLEQAKKVIGAQRKKEQRPKEYKQCNVEAIRVIYDPQRFADRLFATLEGRRRNEKYAIRLLQIALCARVIGVHRLQTLGFYSHLHRYLQPKQKEVTRILLYAAQACHSLVPPDVVEQLVVCVRCFFFVVYVKNFYVRVVAQNFVSDRNTPEAITVGLNTIREIYANCPAAASEEMVRDLAEYKKMNNKNVSMAARALITLFRTTNPKLLHHKDRGRPTADETAAGNVGGGFGQIKTFDHVPGAEILPEDAEEAERMAQLVNSSDDDDDEEEDDAEEETIAEDEEEVDKNMGELGKDGDDECGPDSSEDGDDEEMEDDDEMEDDEEQIGGEMEDDEEQIGGEMEDDEGQIGRVVELKEDGGATKVTRAMKGAQKQQKKSAKKKQALLDRLESVSRAQQISSSRILGDADFRLIRIRQLRRQARLERGGAKRLTNDEARLDEQIQEKFARIGDGLPRLGDIEHFHRKIRRQSKEERMEQVKEGRPGKEAYGKPKKGPHVGRTNREMAKRKPAQMIRQKVRGRNRQRSFRDRQKTLRTYLLRQQGKKL
uniref:Protein SDA1 n=1 Tax=Globodera rostochiensis TaxID=31243 RepID=A0A914GW19_GLORO